jgi:glyoxylase-like metal-dependent hydrolase (beta-lactamase superfamily II)
MPIQYKQLQKVCEGIYGERVSGIVENDHTVTVIDPGYDAYLKRKADGTSVVRVYRLARDLGKPVKYVILTHAHNDHSANLPFYLLNKPAVLVHEKSPIKRFASQSIEKCVAAEIDGNVYRFIPTPGHGEAGDDMSILVESRKIIFVGDIVNPQMIPLYSDGNAYLASLETLLKYDYELMYCAHGGSLGQAEAKATVKHLQKLVASTRDFTFSLFDPSSPRQVICEKVYQKIAQEEGWSEQEFNERRSAKDGNGCTHYDYFNLGILHWLDVAQARARASRG